MRVLFTILLLIASSSAWAMDIPNADSAGGKLFAARCSTCHALPHPQRLDWPHWRHMLGLMQQRMAERGAPEPSREEWRQIADYLKTHAR